MKKVLSLLLVLALCLALCACGKDINEQVEIVGTWKYDTGHTIWTFIFNADGSCTYYSSTVADSYSEDYYYLSTDEEGVVHLYIEELPNWEFYCEARFGKMVIRTDDGWTFKKATEATSSFLGF